MNNPSNGPPVGGRTLLFNGSELTVLVTFQIPVLTAQLTPFNGSTAMTQLLTVSSDNFIFNLAAFFTGQNSGVVIVTTFQYVTYGNGVSTAFRLATTLGVVTPMLVGGWVSVAFSVSGAGVATLSVRDIFTTNNATSGALASVRVACLSLVC